MRIKENSLLIFGIFGSILLIVIKYTEYGDFFRILFGSRLLEVIFNTLTFFPLILLFSLVTVSLPKTTFIAWWKFARFALPLSLGLIVLINLRLHHNPGGWMNLDSAIDFFLVSIIYGIFSIGSAIAIYRGYKQNRLPVVELSRCHLDA